MSTVIPRIMVLTDPARGYDRALMQGMAEYVQTAGPVQLFRPPPAWVNWNQFSLIGFIRESKVDGIMMTEREDVGELLKLGIPVIVSPYTLSEFPGAVNILTDHYAVGRIAADHLIQSGFSHFAYCGYKEMFWAEERFDGFRCRLAETGAEVDVYWGTEVSPEDEKVRLLIWLNNLPSSTGIMACADERGRELIELCVSSGIRVPDQVGVIGVDNDDLLCDLSPVPLSSVANNAERCGFLALKQLVEIILKPGCSKKAIIVEPTYCVGRRSTDLINTEDPDLALAIRYIRQNRNRSIRVEDVAVAAGLSRRVLEKRFKRDFGSSVYTEIRRARVELFGQLLIESGRTVAEIAEQLGFSGVEHVSRYFKSQTGMTPREYRLRFGR